MPVDKNDLQTLDYIYRGEPFVRVIPSSTVSLDTLDYVYRGEPFWAIGEAGDPASSSISAYTYGASYNPTTKTPAYLKGIDPHSRVSAFIMAHNHALSSVKAYTNAIICLGIDSTPAFLAGNIAISASCHANVSGGKESVKSQQSAYLLGISRGIVHCYLNGIIKTTDYVTFSSDERTKRFKVLQEDYDDGTQERTEKISKTISGGIEHSLGAIYTTWSPVIRVRHTESDANYGTKDDLEYFYEQKEITFTDHRGYEYQVRILGKMVKNLITVAIEGTEAIYLYRLQLLK